MQTLAERVGRRDNNFDFIRWFSASLVILSHEYAIHPGPGVEPLAALTQGFATFGTIGVDIFFVISGFLVVRSLVERGRLGFFAASRALRLFPALAAVLALSAFVLGPLLTDLRFGDYFKSKQTYSYLVSNLTLVRMQWDLPGVFVRNPVAGAVNGSLWTLWPEVQMYLLVFLLGLLALPWASSRRAFIVGLGMVIAIVVGWTQHGDLGGHRLEPSTLGRLAPYFALGAVLYLLRAYFPTTGAVPAVAILAAAATWRMPAFVPLFAVALAIVVVWMAHAPLGYLSRWGCLGDFSYGLYIYAFPIQQTLYAALPGWGRYSHFALAYTIALACAVMSWWLVEKPALALKKRLASPQIAPRQAI